MPPVKLTEKNYRKLGYACLTEELHRRLLACCTEGDTPYQNVILDWLNGKLTTEAAEQTLSGIVGSIVGRMWEHHSRTKCPLRGHIEVKIMRGSDKLPSGSEIRWHRILYRAQPAGWQWSDYGSGKGESGR